MLERIKRLYEAHKLSKDGTKNAVSKGWITEAEYKAIVGEVYTNDDVQSPAE